MRNKKKQNEHKKKITQNRIVFDERMDWSFLWLEESEIKAKLEKKT